MKKAEELEKIIDRSTFVTVAVHTHPDGDAIGSGCAMTRFLRHCKGKKAALIVPNVIPPSLEFIINEEDTVLTYTDGPQACQEWIENSDLIICQDCNAFDRIPGPDGFLKESKAAKVLIDHHLNPDSSSFDLVISTPHISSTCELLYDTLKEMKDVDGNVKKLPASCLDALMTGMTTDTNNFANSVFPGTLHMASELLSAGVDRDRILSNIYQNYRENRIRLMGYLFHEKLKITEYGLAYIIFDKKSQEAYDFEPGETEGFVNMPLQVRKIKMSMLLTEEDGKFRVSIRSKVGCSANSFAMKYFNGGGHEQASGGNLRFPEDIPTAEDAERYIIEVSREFLVK